MTVFVDLERRFVQWREGQGLDDADIEYLTTTFAGGLGWPDLLEKSRVVVLAEAGSGKTEELRVQADKQRAAGCYAFYATVQDVAKAGLVGALLPQDREAFNAWLASEETAWLFIDSIDEAKLDLIRVETALRQILEGVYGSQTRARIVLSGRVTDWEYRADLNRLNSTLPVPKTKPDEALIAPDQALDDALQHRRTQRHRDEPPESATVVVMAALDADRVRKFAAAQGIANLEVFMRELDARDLWELARRPADLDWLVQYWRAHGRLGQLAEMLQASLTERLTETNPLHARRDGIAVPTAFEALERLGASFVFGRKDKLAIPDSALALAQVAADPKVDDVLPDWSGEHRRQLLSRPVFDPATFGRVRLHNDNKGAVRSLLAARWLRRMRERRLALRRIRKLLFAKTYGVRLIRPSLAQTTAWLSIWDDDIARTVLATDPKLLMSAGDPGSLPREVRRSILIGMIDRLAGGERWAGWTIRGSLRRFATADLAPEINRAWAEHSGNPNVRVMLLTMIELGHLTGCASVAEEAVFNGFEDHHTAVFAGRALVATASAQTLKRYASLIMHDAEKLDRLMLWEALEALFPAYISAQELLDILARLPLEGGDEALGLGWRGPRLVEKASDPHDLELLLTSLLPRLGEAEWPPKAIESPSTRAYAPIVGASALQLLKATPATAAAAIIAIDAAIRLGAERTHHVDDDSLAEIRQELHRSVERRRAAFWRAADRLAGHPALSMGRLDNIYQMSHLGWEPGLKKDDVPWLLQDAAAHPSEADKLLAIGAALWVWRTEGQPDALIEQIKAVASDLPATATLVEGWLAPPAPSPVEAKFEQEQAAHRARRSIEEAKRKKSWRDFVARLQADPDQLRRLPAPKPDNINADLFYIWELLNSVAGDGNRYAITSVGPLIAIVGGPVAEAARDGFIRFWRQWRPTLTSSRPPETRNVISKIDCMGIVGVSLEAAQNPDWAQRLTSDEATRAAAYATLELNGFPAWLTSLAKACPEEVRTVLLVEITSQLDQATTGPYVGELHDVVYGPKEIAELMAPALLQELERRPQLAGHALTDVLDVLARGLTSNEEQGALGSLALARFKEVQDGETAAHYLGAAFAADPTAAIAALNARLDALPPEAQTSLVEQLLPRIFGDDFRRSGIDSGKLPFVVVERLVEIAFRTIRTEDDIEHPRGETYSPGRRDWAENARNLAFNLLVQTPGRDAFKALRRFKNVEGFPVPADRLEEFARQRAALDSELPPWTPRRAFEFEEELRRKTAKPAPLQDEALAAYGVAALGIAGVALIPAGGLAEWGGLALAILACPAVAYFYLSELTELFCKGATRPRLAIPALLIALIAALVIMALLDHPLIALLHGAGPTAAIR